MSAPELLVLHAVRLAGMADDTAVARRTGLEPHLVTELLRDDEAYGWVTYVEFAGTGGWAITERGRERDAANLADELRATGSRPAVVAANSAFEPLNARLVRACTDWQLRPTDGDRFAANDHTDAAWDNHVLDELSALAGDLRLLVTELAGALPRFAGYDDRFGYAVARARSGHPEWVAGVGIPSCHAVWMELHEDLLSTLGIPRGADVGRG